MIYAYIVIYVVLALILALDLFDIVKNQSQLISDLSTSDRYFFYGFLLFSVIVWPISMIVVMISETTNKKN